VKPVEEHLAECLAAVTVLPATDVPLVEALGCLLDEDVVAAVDLPSFDNSAMDGYAVRVPDVASAAPGHPVRLPVTGDVPAGSAAQLELAPGTAIRIMTGAPLPAGTQAVVPVEWTDRGTETVEITQAPAEGAYLRPAGEDVARGEVVLRRGVRIGPRQIGLLAAVGRATVRAHPRPRVAVLSTGSELVPPGQPLGPGQIHDSNGYAIAAAASELGADARHVGLVADDADSFLAALEAEIAGADLLITTGGVSAGAYDTVKEVLSQVGGVVFEKVAMQPGMPQGFGHVGAAGVPIFTLPGNPVSSMVSFEVFVRPVLRRLFGETDLHRPTVTARAGVAWSSPNGKKQFVRARLTRPLAADAPVVTPVGGQGSHLVADLAEAECLAVVPADVTQVQPGDELTCMLLDRPSR
jgi:molybdopterin molybdotransferase